MKRIGYAIATVILLLIEVLIAIYVHDAFVRPYIGDVLVVVVIYTFIRIFVPERCKLLPLYVFDWKDILCYAVGCILLGVYEVLKRKNVKGRTNGV